MESSTPKELIDLMRIALERAEPYPLDSEDAVVKYDDPRMEWGHPENERLTATIALRFLTENGIKI